MKTFKFLMPILLAAFAFVGCDTDDLKNDIDELKNRVESLEALVSSMNDNINALKVFTDGGKTVQSCVYDEATGKYTVTLSDGQVLVLTQGIKGEATTPSISISDDGFWVINGEEQSVKAEGANAATPEFRISEEGYWQVDLDGDGYQDFTNVLDESGNPVKASTNQSISMSDEFFESVKEENGCLVVTLKDGGKTYSLPIVANLICEIVEPSQGFNAGTLTVGFGKKVELTVKVKGDNYAVTAPAGWTAVLGQPDAESNEATLSLTAPAQASAASRAVADNTKDLTLQVNSGVNWAVDKIQVVAEEVISSYFSLYDSGETLELAGMSINKETYGAAQLVNTADFDFKVETGKVYFIEPGVEVNWKSTENFPNLILIGNNSQVKSKLSPSLQIKIANENADGLFLAHNMEINMKNIKTPDGTKSTYLLTQNKDNSFGKVLFDKTKIIFANKQPLTYISSKDRSIGDLTIQNSLLEFLSGTHQQFMVSLSTSTAKYPSINLVNNVFYTDKADALLTKFKMFNGNQATLGSLKMHNNTLVNITTETSFCFYADVVNTIDVTKNLYYVGAALPNNSGLIRANKFPTGNVCADNIVYKAVANEYNWQVFFGGISKGFEGAQDNTIIDSNPFEGGKFDPSTGTFVTNSAYSGYGATIE